MAIHSSVDLLIELLEVLIFIAICNIDGLGGITLNSDDDDNLPVSIRQSDYTGADRDWISLLETAIETLATDANDASTELLKELQSALLALEIHSADR